MLAAQIDQSASTRRSLDCADRGMSVCLVPRGERRGAPFGRRSAGPYVGRRHERKIGPSRRSPIARSIARAVRGASGMVTILPPLRTTVRVRCPRSRPRLSNVCAEGFGELQSVIASSEIRACSAALPRPAATSSAATSLRSSPTACDSWSGRAAARGRLRNAPVGLHRRRSGRTGNGAQPPRDRCPRPARDLQVPTEALDVSPSGREQVQAPLHAPGHVHPHVEGVGVAGQTGVAGQKLSERGLLVRAEQRLVDRCEPGGRIRVAGRARMRDMVAALCARALAFVVYRRHRAAARIYDTGEPGAGFGD